MLNKNIASGFMLTLTLTLLSGVASAQLSKDSITTVIQQSKKEINGCYESALKKDQTLQGKLTVSFVIEKRGAVERAEIKETSIQSDELKQCVIALFKAMTFPQADKSKQVSYPLIFQKPSADSADQSKVKQAEKAKK